MDAFSRVFYSTLLAALLLLQPLGARAQVCGRALADVSVSGSQVLNTFHPSPTATTNVAVGATAIPVDAARAGGGAPIAAGDLVLVIQMQGAEINRNGENTTGGAYGDGAGGADRRGVIAGATFRAGVHELVRAAGPVAGGSLPILGTLANSYRSGNAITAGGTVGSGFHRYQVIRVIEARDMTIAAGATLTSLAWDGRSGGIVAIDVNRNLVLNGAIDVSGMGFRGGSPTIPPGAIGTEPNTPQPCIKGEGIAGPTSRLYSRIAGVVTAATGLYGGDSERGGPGNAGGCPIEGDSGGGGGGGGRAGGVGSIGAGTSVDPNRARPGEGYADVTRLLFGGGGGSGSLDDPALVAAVSGQAGGGIVYIRAASISGTGAVRANGDTGTMQPQEGGGGGGGGGAIFVYTNTMSFATVNLIARGGDGSATMTADDGGGGGGGGGFVVIATPGGAATVSINVTGGTGGTGTTADDTGAGGTGGFQQISAPPITTPCPPECATAAQCGDGNVCTTDTCSAGRCSNPAVAAGMSGGCGAGLVCSGAPTNMCIARCGDGMVIAPETCDDNNTTAGDGCNATCRREVIITLPTDGTLTRDNTPTISGTADPGAAVTVMVGTQTLTTTANGAGAWSVTAATLADGPYTATARATDSAGGMSSDTATFTIDTVTMVAITAPAMSSTTADSTPEIRGTGEAGATVSVLVDMAVIGTATVGAGGTWTFTVPTALGDGAHRIDVIATDLAGNVADSTAPSMGAMPVTFNVRTGTVVNITAPIGTTRDNTPDVTGTGDAGATIAITLTGPMGMMFTGTATVTAAGTWSFTAPMLAEGNWTTSVIATDTLGNTATDTQPFIVDSSTVVDFLQPLEGSTTGDTTPELSGTGEPGASVAIQIDGMMVATVLVDVEGNWTFQVPSALADGPHTVRVTATDVAGNTATDMGTFTVDSALPALEIRAPGDHTTTSDTTPSISGTTEPGLTVTVTIDGVLLGTTVAGPDGSWTLPVTMPLAAGPHTVLATTVDAVGNAARDQHVFDVDATAPTVDIARPIDGSTLRDNTPTIRGTTEPNTQVQVFVDGALLGTVTSDATGAWTIDVTSALADGGHTMRAVATDAAGNTATDNGGFIVDRAAHVDFMQPGSDGPIGDTTPELSGTGDPGGSVVVTLDGMVIGTVSVDAEGNWTLQVPTALANGMHSVSVTLTNDLGATATDTGTFVINTMAPALEIRTPADNSTTADTTPTITGSSDPGALVAVYIDGVLLGTTTTNLDGTWTIPVTAPLMGGVHTALATTTNASGISVTDQHDFNVDTAAPAVDVTAPAGRITNRMPALVGTSESGAEVQVFLDGVLVGTVTVGADGAWSVPTTTMLAEGEHTVRAVATDDVGNTATDSGAFVIDTATTVVIDRPADMAVIGSPRPTYLGTAEPGATVTVSIDGMPIGMVVVGADGRWTFAQTTDLAPGAHQITAASVDSVGNTATDTNTFTFDPAMLDSDGDGLLDTVECPMAGSCPDSDMDGMPDQLDPDDDGDGVPTAIECSTPGSCTDTDMDMRPDYLDPDDDGDGRPTRDERPGMISVDTDGDGAPDYLDTDDDGDGLLTSAECMAAPCRDTDMDMRPDYLDPDDDNDGILTARERADGMRIGAGGDDVDMDGTPNWLDTNSDGDSANDREEGLRDSDMDGRPDYLDPNTPAPTGDAGVRGDAGRVDAGAGGADAGDAGPIVGGLAGGACGCSAAGTQGTTRGFWLAMMALVAVVVRRRMKR